MDVMEFIAVLSHKDVVVWLSQMFNCLSVSVSELTVSELTVSTSDQWSDSACESVFVFLFDFGCDGDEGLRFRGLLVILKRISWFYYNTGTRSFNRA